jgi:hypothetical protein
MDPAKNENRITSEILKGCEVTGILPSAKTNPDDAIRVVMIWIKVRLKQFKETYQFRLPGQSKMMVRIIGFA